MATVNARPRRPRPDTSVRQPKSRIGYFLWRHRMCLESTFVLSVLEPWEQVLLLTIFGFIFVLVLTGLFKYLPHHLIKMQRRAVYYLWGQEGDERLIWQWLGLVVGEHSEGLHEL